MLTYSEAIVHFWYRFNLQPSTSCMSVFQTLIVICVVFSHAVMVYYVWLAGYIKNGLYLLPEMPTRFFFSNTVHRPKDTYINDKLLASGFCNFIKAWSIRSWPRVTEFVNLKSHSFYFLYLVFVVSINYKTKKIIISSMHV